jgi:hypothetical protein
LSPSWAALATLNCGRWQTFRHSTFDIDMPGIRRLDPRRDRFVDT